MPIQHPRLRGAGKMSYIHITEENIDKEHICCAMSGKQSLAKKSGSSSVSTKVSSSIVARNEAKCFIEYIPAEKRMGAIDADGVDLYQLSMGGRFFERSWTFR